jgi:Kef-type K+ transport system membrane component KefB/mannitol/fructose-specific phosphotransferase system IIA component (Ntr-type)
MIFLFLFCLPSIIFASGGTGEGTSLTHSMMVLVIQLAVLIFAAKTGGYLAKKIGMPSVLGELLSGIVVGPYLLGSIPLPGLFEQGLFTLGETGLAVSPELYGFATIASIILLFLAGLETDLPLFLKFSLKGSVVGLGGVLFSFFLGIGFFVFLGQLGVPLFAGADPFSPQIMFLGVLSVATSVGITARILSEKRQMDSAEGVTILSAAVIDDVLGIIILAIVIGIFEVSQISHGGVQEGLLEWGKIGLIALQAIGIWLVATILGLIFSSKISRFLKRQGSKSQFAILALGLALLLAGIFEQFGLAMIIGAYVMGLSLSKTDIAYVVQEKLHPLHDFFVPIFFAVMGMLVNLESLMDPMVLLTGVGFALVAILAKVLGGGLPALGMNFNLLGATRIGLGMVPRGEVALIIAGIGKTTGILTDSQFGIGILMTLITTLVAPPLLNKSLTVKGKGTNKDFLGQDKIQTVFSYEKEELKSLIGTQILNQLKKEGFFLNLLELEHPVYQIRRDNIFLTLTLTETELIFSCAPEDAGYVKTLVYETLVELDSTVNRLKETYKADEIQKNLAQSEASGTNSLSLGDFLNLDRISVNLKSQTKGDVILELINLVADSVSMRDKDLVIKDILAREESMSTGLQDGIAIPHARTEGIEDLYLAVGVKADGLDFASLDGQLSRIFCLIVGPKKKYGPHIQLLSALAGVLKDAKIRQKILSGVSKSDLIALLEGYN